MDPSEVEFIAEKELVSIVPNFTNNEVHLISGDVGPFRAGLPVNVPIWMALNLRQRQKCRIIAPDWLDVEKLEALIEGEKSNRFFTKMPSEHYMVVAQLLLSAVDDDIPRVEEIRMAVKDLWDVRISKLRSSVDTFIKTGGPHARLDYLTTMEINSVRPLLPQALDFIDRLNKVLKKLTTFVFSLY
ncbi:putative DNA replication complex GINS protein PSF2 [Frankliniella fusca]|uniref:DNA replication complex GINS protein PSF2 n=1 Tax=Frankliniella fusca TaxID=407009 RepID=A0AAE1LX75_9NEOP|nr:putative DNA replication complex GINS protein PSF2 [Frankliniella fusca]